MKKPGRLLKTREFNPIESSDHTEIAEHNGSFKNAFQGHCRVCAHRTGEDSALQLIKTFMDNEGANEAWESLSRIYVQEGYDVYDGQNVFEVYEPEKDEEATQLSYPMALELAEQALNQACLTIQDALMVDDGGEAGVSFSDDSFSNLMLPYILREFENSELPWHRAKCYLYGKDMSEAAVNELFARCIVPSKVSRKYFAIVDDMLFYCPMHDDSNLPVIEEAALATNLDVSETDWINKHFGTDFQPSET